MKLTHFFGSSSSKIKESGNKGSGKRTTTRNAGKSCSFGSTSSSYGSVTTPRTVLPPLTSSSVAPSGSGGVSKKPVAVGAVTLEELEVALRRVVSTEEELAEVLAEAEAAGRLALEGQAADEGELRETFEVFDADGDGRISAEELRAVLASLGDELCSVEDCRRMIGGVDTDGDGFVCFDEFTRMMMHAP